jgi:hypothetical protein
LVSFPLLFVDFGDEVLHFLSFFVADWLVLNIIVEECREHVGHCLAFGVSVGEGSCVDDVGKQPEDVLTSSPIATNQSVYFPEPELVEEISTWYAYLANGCLKQVVGG